MNVRCPRRCPPNCGPVAIRRPPRPAGLGCTEETDDTIGQLRLYCTYSAASGRSTRRSRRIVSVGGDSNRVCISNRSRRVIPHHRLGIRLPSLYNRWEYWLMRALRRALHGTLKGKTLSRSSTKNHMFDSDSTTLKNVMPVLGKACHHGFHRSAVPGET